MHACIQSRDWPGQLLHTCEIQINGHAVHAAKETVRLLQKAVYT